jgi:hypothetical protein
MTERTFGGHTLVDLKKLRRHPADGANFYLAFLEAAPEMFQLAEEFETLESFVLSMVKKIEKPPTLPPVTTSASRYLMI